MLYILLLHVYMLEYIIHIGNVGMGISSVGSIGNQFYFLIHVVPIPTLPLLTYTTMGYCIISVGMSSNHWWNLVT